MKNYFFIFLCVFMFIEITFGQQTDIKKRSIPLEIKYGNHSFGFICPFGKPVQAPFSPSIYVGSEFQSKRHKFVYRSYGVNWFYHPNVESAVSVLINSNYRFTTKFGLMAEVFWGGGYNHSFIQKHIYKRNSNGLYEKKKNNGAPGILFSVGYNIGYDFSLKTDLELIVFIGQNMTIQVPHYLSTALPHNYMQVGVKFKIERNEE